jgi:ABC-type multidrug transport system fused ATPase/permease subunit
MTTKSGVTIEREATSIWSAIGQLFQYVPRRRKMQGIGVFAMMLVGAFAELLTIGAIIPFLALISNRSLMDGNSVAARALRFLHVTNYESAILTVAAGFCLIAVIAAAIRILLVWASQGFVFRLGYDIGTSLLERMLFQSYSWHASQNSSRIISGINKVQSVLNQSMLPVLQGMISITIAVFIILGLLLLSPGVAVLSVAVFGGIYGSISYLSRKRLARNSKVISQAASERTKVIQEGLGGIRDVIIDEAQPIFLKKFSRIDRGLRDAQATNALIAAVPRYAIEGLGMVLIALLALMLSSRSGGLTSALPVLGAMALGAQRLLPLLQQIYNGWTSIQGNRGTLLDVLSLLDRPMPQNRLERRNDPPLPFEHEIRFEQVSFKYAPEGASVVRNLDLVIRKGDRVGLVGKTGSGKTTTVDLLMGLLEPVGGKITVDGKALTSDNLHRWQKQIAHVPQSIYLADTSILENIAFGVERRLIDVARVKEAAERADIASYILQQADGYDTPVGERGVRLSGGQRQRIGIARALYKRSSVLILDEATSALDNQTETSIMQSVAELGHDITVIMIAHRTTTLRGTDFIVDLREGQIVRQGTYAELFLTV